jgi:hypothetical protein
VAEGRDMALDGGLVAEVGVADGGVVVLAALGEGEHRAVVGQRTWAARGGWGLFDLTHQVGRFRMAVELG